MKPADLHVKNPDQTVGHNDDHEEDIKQLSPEELLELASRHIEAGKIRTLSLPVAPNCIDGRFTNEELTNNEGQKKILQRPGGAEGISQAMLKLRFSAEVAYKSVFKFLNDKGIKYGWHSDNHDNTINNAAFTESTSHQGICLHGNHKERFVIIVTGSNGWSVLPTAESTNAFIYDQDQDFKLLAEFSNWFNNNYSKSTDTRELEADDLINAVKFQNAITLKLLAEGKPVLEVNFSQDGQAEIVSTQFVEPLTEDEVKMRQDLPESNLKVSYRLLTGCGHCNLAYNNPLLYGVSREEVRTLHELAVSATT